MALYPSAVQITNSCPLLKRFDYTDVSLHYYLQNKVQTVENKTKSLQALFLPHYNQQTLR